MNRILLSPDEQPSAAAGVFEEAAPAAAEVEAAPIEKTVEAPPTPPAAPVTHLTKEELSTILSGAVKAGQPAPAQPQFNQDDFDRTFNVFKPNKELVDAIRAGDEGAALEAVAKMTMGIVKQAVTMSAFQMQQMKDEMNSRFAPALSFTEKQVEVEMKKEFFSLNKDLEPYEPLVLKVVADLQAQKGSTISKDDAFKKVADETRKLLASIPGLKVPATNGQGASPTATTSKMSTLSSGGQGGAGGSPTSSTPKSAGLAVFD